MSNAQITGPHGTVTIQDELDTGYATVTELYQAAQAAGLAITRSAIAWHARQRQGSLHAYATRGHYTWSIQIGPAAEWMQNYARRNGGRPKKTES